MHGVGLWQENEFVKVVLDLNGAPAVAGAPRKAAAGVSIHYEALFGVHTDMFTVNGVTERQIGDKKLEARPDEVVFIYEGF